MYLLSCTISKLWLITGQIFASDRGCFTFAPSLGINCTLPETRMIVLPDTEDRMIIS